jgi:hypothetical protein
MERKYKQRGYMDDPSSEGTVKKERGTNREGKLAGIKQYGMRNGGTARSGVRCARCGKSVHITEVNFDSTCEYCGADLHTCTNCGFFNTSARWECSKPIPERVSPKDARNTCTFFNPAVFVERTFESGATAQDARKAFDALFKK